MYLGEQHFELEGRKAGIERLEFLHIGLFFIWRIPWKIAYLPLDPKTMKNEGFTPPKYGLQYNP